MKKHKETIELEKALEKTAGLDAISRSLDRVQTKLDLAKLMTHAELSEAFMEIVMQNEYRYEIIEFLKEKINKLQ